MKRDLGYQSNSLGVKPPTKGELSKEQEEQLIAVQNCLMSDGYRVLHRLFADNMQMAELELLKLDTSLDKIRYYQGWIAALAAVQGRFVDMSKESSYVK